MTATRSNLRREGAALISALYRVKAAERKRQPAASKPARRPAPNSRRQAGAARRSRNLNTVQGNSPTAARRDSKTRSLPSGGEGKLL